MGYSDERDAHQVSSLYASYDVIERASFAEGGHTLRNSLRLIEAQICAVLERNHGSIRISPHMVLVLERCHIDGVLIGTWFVAKGDHNIYQHPNVASAGNTELAAVTTPKSWRRGLIDLTPDPRLKKSA